MVNPPEQSPEVSDETPGGTPGDKVPNTVQESELPDVDTWKKSLRPEDQKQVDRIVTGLRQKDSQELADLRSKTQRLGWAEELNRLVASENPADRTKASALLESTLGMLKQFTPQPEADPMAGVDFESIEALAPGLGKLVQHQAQTIQALQEKLGTVASTAQSIETRAADEALDREIKGLETWAKETELPYDESEVLATAEKLGITDVKAAYYATYGERLLERGKQSALKSLQTKQRASLPGASPSSAVGQRPKVKNMMEAFELAQRDAGGQG